MRPQPEGVHAAIVGGQVDPPAGQSDTAIVIPAIDSLLRRVDFLAGFRVESVKDRVINIAAARVSPPRRLPTGFILRR